MILVSFGDCQTLGVGWEKIEVLWMEIAFRMRLLRCFEYWCGPERYWILGSPKIQAGKVEGTVDSSEIRRILPVDMVNTYPIIVYKFWNKSQLFFFLDCFHRTNSITHTHTHRKKSQKIPWKVVSAWNESKTMGPLALWHFGLSKDWWKKGRSYFFYRGKGRCLETLHWLYRVLVESAHVKICQDISRNLKPQVPQVRCNVRQAGFKICGQKTSCPTSWFFLRKQQQGISLYWVPNIVLLDWTWGKGMM